MKKRKINTRTIVATGLLLAVEIVLQLLSTIIPTGVNLNLSLVVITLGALLYGPYVGGFLGLASGAIVLLSPNTVTVFMSISPVATVFTCLLKTFFAGLIAGFVFKLFKGKNEMLGAIICSIIVPVVNTGIFVIFTYFFFMEGLGLPNFASIFTALIGINFIFEVLTNTIICPILFNISNQVNQKNVASAKKEDENVNKDTLD